MNIFNMNIFSMKMFNTSIFKDIHSIDDLIRKIKEYQNYLLAGIGIIAILVGSALGYFNYKKNREERAYRALVSAVEYFDATIKTGKEEAPEDLAFLDKKEFESHKEKWEKTIKVFEEAYAENSSSGIATLFLAYQAKAATELGMKEKAIELLRKIVSDVPNKSVSQHYSIKLALLLIDSKKKDLLEEGVEILKNAAEQGEGISHDSALYRLGEYYWYNKNFKEARNYWNQLLIKYGKGEKYLSPWVAVAKEKLSLIDSDVD